MPVLNQCISRRRKARIAKPMCKALSTLLRALGLFQPHTTALCLGGIPQSTTQTPPTAAVVGDSSANHWSPSSQCHRLGQLSWILGWTHSQGAWTTVPDDALATSLERSVCCVNGINPSDCVSVEKARSSHNLNQQQNWRFALNQLSNATYLGLNPRCFAVVSMARKWSFLVAPSTDNSYRRVVAGDVLIPIRPQQARQIDALNDPLMLTWPLPTD